MNLATFKTVVSKFADSPKDIDIRHGEAVLQISDQIITFNVIMKDGDVYVRENDFEQKAEKWISVRLAKLHLLADRLLSYITTVENYVPIPGILDEMSDTSNGEASSTLDVEKCIINFSDNKLAGTTSILYLTSDAGEGKTTIINEAVRRQADRYKSKQSNWLIVPISLGGRPFIRFDDVVVATLLNKFRFPFIYYDAVIELIKLGFIVLALDGFEEMFVEGPKGEGISSLGGLLEKLESEGIVVIAARKAYFEFKNFKTQGKLFDTLSSRDVIFSKLSINRWGKDQFITYGKLRGVNNAEEIYATMSEALGPEHPLLSRAVLVRKVFDIADTDDNRIKFLEKVKTRGDNFFKEFIDAIIEREVVDKWLDKGGEAARPLMTLEDHYEILSYIAEEMWLSSVSCLQASIFDMIADLVSEKLGKAPIIARQIKERIKQHALIIKSEAGKDEFEFDHDEFRQYFLAHRLSQLILSKRTEDFKILIRQSLFSSLLIDLCISNVKRVTPDVADHVLFLNNASMLSSMVSVSRENCGALIVKLIDCAENPALRISELNFPADCLVHKKISNVTFVNCFFSSSDISSSEFSDCEFIDCKFERLDVSGNSRFTNVLFTRSLPMHLCITESDTDIFDPVMITKCLLRHGITVVDDLIDHEQLGDVEISEDNSLAITKRAVRHFLRTTSATDSKLRLKLGKDANYFIDDVLPLLLKHKIIIETEFRGRGTQRRFKVGIKMSSFEDACIHAKGCFKDFLAFFEHK